MAPKKKQKKTWPGPLGEPIVAALPRIPEEGKVSPPDPRIWEQRVGKIPLLLKHYGVPDPSLLALALAIDFVPGFQVVYDDPLAPTLGLPTSAGAKAGNKGRGFLPWMTGQRLLLFVEGVSNNYVNFSSDRKCAELIVDNAASEKLVASAREAKVKTIERRIRTARLERDGPVGRGKSKTH